ncbi:MAG: OB-fold nucleic acid binding domain-containing protein, partial [Bdellovibrionales bacterium]
YVKDAQKHNIEVKAPHINFSDYLFTCMDRLIYFGLGAIKGVGQAAVEAILQARDQQPTKKFEKIEDFFSSVDPKKLNKKVVECLIKAGALDGFGYHRAQLMLGYQKLMDLANRESRDREIGQVSLFDMDPSLDVKVELPEVTPWSRTFQLSSEKEVIGFYLSDHPLNGMISLVSHWTTGTVSQLSQESALSSSASNVSSSANAENKSHQSGEKRRVVLAGLLVNLREVITRKGTRMAFGQLEDLTGQMEVVIFPDSFAKYEALVKSERPILIGGAFEASEGSGKILLDTAISLDDIFLKAKRVVFHLEKLKLDDYPQLHKLLSQHAGSTPLRIEVWVEDLKRRVQIETAQISGVKLSTELLEDLRSQFSSMDFFEIQSGAL